MPKKWFPLLALLLSGGAALILQVIWTRMGILLLGTTTRSATIVMGTFMAGLALGNFFSGRILGRIRRPFLAYALLEAGTLAFSVGGGMIFRKYGATQAVPAWFFMGCLLLPTSLMGMTLPLVIRGLLQNGWDSSSVTAWAYGINTIGGAIGALCGAFLFLPRWGLFGSALLGAGLLLSCILIILPFAVSRSAAIPDRESSSAEQAKSWRGPLLLAAWGGASGLALEIVWTRLLSLILGPSVYALGVVLFVYLLGIALGSILVAQVQRIGSARDRVCAGFMASSLSVAWGIGAVGILPYLFLWLVSLALPGSNGLRWIEVLVSMIAIAPSAVLQGFLLPALIQTFPRQRTEGQEVAWMFGANTLGAIAGAALAGLWLIPTVGFLRILATVVVVNLIIGMVFFMRLDQLGTRVARGFVAFTFALFLGFFLWNASGFWDRAVLASGVYKYGVAEAFNRDAPKIGVGEILFYKEGRSSTVAVIRTHTDEVLSIDGKVDATAHGDQSTQVLLAALPLSLSEESSSTLVIGHASGVTAGVATLFPKNKVISVEIEPAVYEASAFFRDVNHGPLLPPHRMLVDDARNFLLRTSDQFDVITSEPSNPWMSGVAPLFTREFFQLAQRRLRPGGVMCQWLPIYGMASHLIASVMHTFASQFSHVMVFESVEGYDLLLIGSDMPIAMNPRILDKRWTDSALQDDLESLGIRDGYDLVARFLMGNDGVRKFSENAVTNTDDNGYLEFGAPLFLHFKTADFNHRLLSQKSEGVTRYLADEFHRGRGFERLKGEFGRRDHSDLMGVVTR